MIWQELEWACGTSLFKGVKHLEITDVRIRRIKGDGRVRAIASITINDAIAVHDVRVVEGDRGLFISMPSRRRVSGEYYDVAHPVTAEARSTVQSAVLTAFSHEITGDHVGSSAQPPQSLVAEG